MTEQMVETPVTEPVVSASTPAPATPATQPDIEALRSAAKDEARREAQSAKDREIARLHQTYQQREKALLSKVKGTLQSAGYEDADRLEQQLVAESELEEYRAMKSQQAAKASSQSYGEGLIQDIADRYEVKIPKNDPRLWDEPFENWDQFKERIRELAKTEVAAKRAAEKEKMEGERREAVDTRLASGELNTLGGAPSGTPSGNQLDEKYKKEMYAVRGKGNMVGRDIKDKYRKLGVEVDTIRL